MDHLGGTPAEGPSRRPASPRFLDGPSRDRRRTGILDRVLGFDLDIADKWGSVASAVVAAAGLLLTIATLMARRRHRRRDGQAGKEQPAPGCPDPHGTVKNHVGQGNSVFQTGHISGDVTWLPRDSPADDVRLDKGTRRPDTGGGQ